MNKGISVVVILTAFWIGGCSSLHDKKGWEHQGDSETRKNTQPYILEHQH